MVMPSPVAPTESVDRMESSMAGLYFTRMSMFEPKPPLASTTALHAMVDSLSVTVFFTFTPVMASPLFTNSTAGEFFASVNVSISPARFVSFVVISLPLCVMGMMERFVLWPPNCMRSCFHEMPPSKVSHCELSSAPSAMICTRAGSPALSPPSSMSFASASGLSAMPSCTWIQLPGAAISPPDSAVSPPNTPIFSSSTTLLPAFAAVMAAAKPAPPPPTTTTSADAGSSVCAGVALSRFLQSLDFWPAWSSASLTAPMNAMLESVAPDTVSTFSVWLSTINCVSSSMATSPMPGVSRELRTVMRSKLPSVTMTSTSNCPCLPMPDPMPAELPDPAPFEPFAFDEPLGAHPANASVPPKAATAPPVMNCLREKRSMMLPPLRCRRRAPASGIPGAYSLIKRCSQTIVLRSSDNCPSGLNA